MKDLYIVSKALRGIFTESRLIALFSFLINMSVEVKI